MIAVLADTPCYVLLEANCRIGPDVLPMLSGLECLSIYGFSDKEPYDKFCANSQLALTPYPLVKGYLQTQAEIRDKRLKLVVLDPVGPREALLDAATMEAVLVAQQNRTPQVTVTHQLSFDREANAYRVEEAFA
jgi:hypothetical protein